jgi:hypothetical protein
MKRNRKRKMAAVPAAGSTSKLVEQPRPVSKLGRELRAISDRIAASGLPPLTRRQIARRLGRSA